MQGRRRGGHPHREGRTGGPAPGRRQPRPQGLRRPAPLRHRTRQCGQAPVVLRRQALLPRRRTGPRGGRGRPADVLRPLSRDAGWPARAAVATPGCCAAGRPYPSSWERRTQYGCDVDFRAALIDEDRGIRRTDPHRRSGHAGSDVSGVDDQDSCSATSDAETGGPRRSSPIGATRRSIPAKCRDGKPPDDPDAAIDWLKAGAQLLVDSVDGVGADTAVWTFIGPRPAQLVDPPPRARSDGAPRRRGDRRWCGLPAGARARRRRHHRVAGARRHRGASGESAPLDDGPDLASARHRRRSRRRRGVVDRRP